MTRTTFAKRLKRLRRILVQEMMDGCIECRKLKALCRDHQKEAIAMWLRPKESERLQDEIAHLKKA